MTIMPPKFSFPPDLVELSARSQSWEVFATQTPPERKKDNGGKRRERSRGKAPETGRGEQGIEGGGQQWRGRRMRGKREEGSNGRDVGGVGIAASRYGGEGYDTGKGGGEVMGEERRRQWDKGWVGGGRWAPAGGGVGG